MFILQQPCSTSDNSTAMTHTFNDYSFPLEPNVPPPQSYSTSSQSMHLSSSGDYIQEQYGGGCHSKSSLVELTPTRLRSRIKATQHNVGIVKEAAIWCQQSSFSPNTLTSPSAPPESAPLHPIHNNSIVGGDASSALPQGNIQHTSPHLHAPEPPHPAPLQDMFYNPMEAQYSGWLVHQSHSFGVMDDASFTALLMETQEHFMSSDVGLDFANQPPSLHACSCDPPVPQSVGGSSSQIAPIITNIIPPTLLKDAGPPPHASLHEHGAFINTGNVDDLLSNPQDSKVRLPRHKASHLSLDKSLLTPVQSSKLLLSRLSNHSSSSQGRHQFLYSKSSTGS